MANLLGIGARLRRDYVVEWSHLETAAWQQINAEILGVPIRGAQQPECNRRFEKGPLILRRGIAPAQQMKNRFDPRPPVALILAGRNDRKRLAAVLLGQTQ